MLSPKTKRNFFRIIPFGIIWLIFSLVYSLLERGLLGNLYYYPSTGNPYNFNKTIWITAITAFVLGLLIGTAEVLYLHRLFTKKRFIKKIVYKLFVYLVIIILFLLFTTIFYNAVLLRKSIFDKMVLDNVWLFFADFAFWSVVIYIAAIICVSLFYIEVSDNLGQGVLNNFLMGKYHTPKQEVRIFMFLDMKSSTTIAENIGHVKYFKMLKNYFADLSDSIIKYAGEIYQYVGDEVVISWTLKNGTADHNCIRCFFAMKNEMEKRAEKYKQEFGFLPAFKAGLHCGNVTTGEIGVIKREIIFTGDVLNTTARIQALCNSFGVDILISGQLLESMDINSQFQLKPLGETRLRGRDEKIELFTLWL